MQNFLNLKVKLMRTSPRKIVNRSQLNSMAMENSILIAKNIQEYTSYRNSFYSEWGSFYYEKKPHLGVRLKFNILKKDITRVIFAGQRFFI